MDFEITKLYQADGVDERLELKALRDANIGDYMILDSTFEEDGTVTNYFRHPYWFPGKEVKKGDFVGLYTKPGKEYSSGNTHFFYLGVKHNIWNDGFDSVTLLHISEIAVKRFSDIHVKKK